ncbi:hypothetical protein [Gottfriedia luciferensis]|uniref:hypothetical protein n=1 Tax=Gottfriedia luciferensis TaxID=178774 RepID=UPI000B44F7CD|nr:hypothetical protein [Gottfriedia luciferensis]
MTKSNSYNLAFSQSETEDYKSFFMSKLHKPFVFDEKNKAFTKNIQKVLKRLKNNSIVKKDYTTDV